MNNQAIILLLLTLFFFLGAIFLIIFCSALLNIDKIEKGFQLNKKNKKLPLIFCLKTFLKDDWHNLYLLTRLTKNIVTILFTTCFLLFLLEIGLSKSVSIIITTLCSITINLIMAGIGKHFHKKTLYLSSLISSIYIYPLFPLTNLVSTISRNISSTKGSTENLYSTLHDININKVIDPKFLSSLLTFQEKAVREVMIPRVRVFSLSADTSIRKASKEILSQGFSRIPVYKEKIDNIIGVLMYKDVLKAYVQTDSKEVPSTLLDTPVESLIHPVIYAPENKKIFQLFHEFRSKKRHLGIVVNEYGGTEGIITIEDILEELVGEIQDEYDVDEERQLWKLPNNTWIIDAKLSIIDLEKKLNIHISHSPEYETIGGFIFHRAGSIPKKGWSLLLDEFEIEVLISNERCIEKIRITPLNSKNE